MILKNKYKKNILFFFILKINFIFCGELLTSNDKDFLKLFQEYSFYINNLNIKNWKEESVFNFNESIIKSFELENIKINLNRYIPPILIFYNYIKKENEMDEKKFSILFNECLKFKFPDQFKLLKEDENNIKEELFINQNNYNYTTRSTENEITKSLLISEKKRNNCWNCIKKLFK